MTSFLRHLKAAWYFGRMHRYVPTPNEFWTVSDARSLLTYFNSTSGLKLKQILTNQVLELSVSATQTKSNEQRDKCGYASGARGIISVMESYMTISPDAAQSVNSEAQEEDVPESFERYTS